MPDIAKIVLVLTSLAGLFTCVQINIYLLSHDIVGKRPRMAFSYV